MRRLYTTIAAALITATVSAQSSNVGINTPTPDPSAALAIDTTAAAGPQGMLAPRMTQARRDAIAAPATGLLVYQTDATPGFYTYTGAAWAPLTIPSQLEKITEGSNTGYRLLGSNPNNYGNIGNGAVDLSYSNIASSTYGATGQYALASGFRATASGDYSAAIGSNLSAPSFCEVAVGYANLGYTPVSQTFSSGSDRAFVVGTGGIDAGGARDGFVVYKSGTTLISNSGNSGLPSTGTIVPGVDFATLQVRAFGAGMTLSTPNYSTGLNIYKRGGTPANGQAYISFGQTGSGISNEHGRIVADGSNGVLYQTLSDARLKVDNGAYHTGLQTVKAVRIHNYTWKSNGAKETGVFAQELYKVYPNAVSKGDDGAEVSQRWMVDYSKLVPVLTAAVQELSDENDQLKAELAALKADRTAVQASLDKLNARLDALDRNAMLQQMQQQSARK